MKVYLLLAAVSSLSIANAASAQVAATPAPQEAAPGSPQAANPEDAKLAPSADADDGSLLSDIVVTAQKKSVGERAQDVPIAITAIGATQLVTLNVRSLTDLSAVAPNVNLDPNSNVRGYANFAMRGSGLNSSVPSLDPAVGLFVDGVYQGVPAGSIADSFDLASVQILRGPQGTLFGRNVTGGAVLVETARPTNKLDGYVDASVETGPEYALKGAVGGALVPDVLSARLAAYYRNDTGWFHNDFDGSKLGKLETFIVRPSFALTVGSVKETLIFEYGHSQGEGNGPQALNATGFTINVNYPGASDQTWYSATSETVIGVGFGDGSITNVFGYRKYKQFSGIDLDSTPLSLFQFNTFLDQRQVSDELRYAGRFGPVELTIGGYYMHQNLLYRESRNPFAAGARGGGGVQISDNYGAFAQGTLKFTDRLSATGGLRYSYETKSAVIKALAVGSCIDARQVCDVYTAPTVNSTRNFRSIIPKVGFDFKANRDLLLYASFSQAFRSGGYNLRISSPLDPGTYNPENMTAYEIGMKGDFLDRKLRINVSAFINNYKGLQRTNTTFIGPNIVQLISNSADARIKGVEIEVTAQPAPGLEFLLGAGYLDARYTAVRGDLNGDGLVNNVDLNLPLVRVPKWSFSAGATYDLRFGSGASLRSQIFYSYRSRQAAQDSAVAFYDPFNDLRMDVTFTLPNRKTSASLFARNLTNEPHNVAGISVLSTFPSGGTRVISEGRSIGVELRQKF